MSNGQLPPPQFPLGVVCQLRNQAAEAIAHIKAKGGQAIADEAGGLLRKLQDHREFGLLRELAEGLRRDVDHPSIARRLAQGLIEDGAANTALDVLNALVATLSNDSPEWAEAHGLMGRAWKQIFYENPNKDSTGAKRALRNALDQYRIPFEREQQNVWHAVNLLALARYAAVHGLAEAGSVDRRQVATQVLETLGKLPEDERDDWFHPSQAEAYLALDELDRAVDHIRAYVASDRTTAFALGGTLRQFVDLWQLDHQGEKGKLIVEALRAALLRKQYGSVRVTPQHLQRLVGSGNPSQGQLEKILGREGPQTYQWWMNGATCAQSVGCIRDDGEGRRIATGFVVRGGDIIPLLGDQRCLLTNHHVVSDPVCDHGEIQSILPGDASVSFDALEDGRRYRFDQVLWQSCDHDATLLSFAEQADHLKPLKLAANLPVVDGRQCVYVIGHPNGRDLSISFQDNLLLEHEGPPQGTPPNPDIRRVQYRAPTEPGSSGSPVFSASWKVVALHHAGDATAMPKLNGQQGSWPANQGIAIQSIIAAARQ